MFDRGKELEPRAIFPYEHELVQYLLKNIPNQQHAFCIPNQVYTMTDGGMGSIHFVTETKQKYKECVVNADYLDSDKIWVLISLDLGDNNELFEMDFFKGDFSELIDYPKPDNVSIRQTGV